jgi:serine/threonine-protein kinase
MTTQENMLARHSIVRELGRGAISAAYAARDRATGAVVVLKRLDPGLLQSNPGFADRFLEEARKARRLRHPNIVRIHDAEGAAGTAYVAMELLEGENLRTILDRGPLSVARALRIADGIACGLAHAHLQGLVHGDLKPSNVIVLDTGEVKITDFGIGQLGQAALSPEQARGEPADFRSDVFALGTLLYEMLTGRRPFAGDSPKEVTENILHAEPPPPSEVNRRVPRALDAIVASMLAKAQADRMAGIPVLLRELQDLEEGLGLPKAAAAGAEPQRAEEPSPKAPAPEAPAANPPPAAPEPSGPSLPDDWQQRLIRLSDQDVQEYARRRDARPEQRSRSGLPLFAGLALLLAVIGFGLAQYIRGGPLIAEVTSLLDDWSANIGRRIARSTVQDAPATAGASQPIAPPPVPEVRKEEPKTTAPAPQPAAPQAQASAPIQPPAPAPAQPQTPAPAEPQAPAPAEPQASAPVQVASAPAQPEAPPPPPALVPPESTDSLVLSPHKQPARTHATPAPQRPLAMQSSAKRPAPAPAKPAQLILAISPRGELYIDGEHRGTTPPLTTFDLAPGVHRIEVRSGSRTPYLTYMNVEPGDVRRIRYDFEAKGSRPPPR